MTHYMNIAIPNAQLEGIILGKTSITLENGASITGRALAQTEVTLDGNTITKPRSTTDQPWRILFMD